MGIGREWEIQPGDRKPKRTAAGLVRQLSIEGWGSARAQCEPTMAGGGKRAANRCSGDRRGLSGWLGGARGGTITTGIGTGPSPVRTGDGRRLPLLLLVSEALGRWVRQGLPVGYGLDGRVLPLRQRACQADPWRLRRLAKMVENPLHWSAPGRAGADAPIGSAVPADDGQRLEHACERRGPQAAGRGADA